MSNFQNSNTHPSQDTGSACVWCDSWGGPWRPCKTAMPPLGPSRRRRGRRSEGMRRSGCTRPEGAEREEENKCDGKLTGSNGHTVDSLFARCLTLFRVCVCPIRMRAFEEMIDRQKLMRMTERSDRMYLQEGSATQNRAVDCIQLHNKKSKLRQYR